MFTTGSRDLGIGYSTGFGSSGIVHRLYDLENDPLESNYVSEKYPEVMKQIQQEMLPRFMEKHPDANKCPEGLTLEGKIEWFCEPRDVETDQSLTDEPVRVFK